MLELATVISIWISAQITGVRERGDGRFPPTAVVSPYTLQWATIRHIGFVPPLLF